MWLAQTDEEERPSKTKTNLLWKENRPKKAWIGIYYLVIDGLIAAMTW